MLQRKGSELRLSDDGRTYALRIIRVHRLWERYLADETGVQESDWHEHAEEREHALSPGEANALSAEMGHPRFDPHGAPIPSRSGAVSQPESGRLVDMKAGDKLVVVEVDDQDADLLRYLGEMGIYPGTRLELIDCAPFNGPLMLQVGDTQHNLGYQAAKSILVAVQN